MSCHWFCPSPLRASDIGASPDGGVHAATVAEQRAAGISRNPPTHASRRARQRRGAIFIAACCRWNQWE